MEKNSPVKTDESIQLSFESMRTKVMSQLPMRQPHARRRIEETPAAEKT